jgi:PKD domain/Periplasmic copper-binding protein (NosD)
MSISLSQIFSQNPINLIGNPSFENLGACASNPGDLTIFNRNNPSCLDPWFSPFPTPTIKSVQAQNGARSACVASYFDSQGCSTEAIAQTLVLAPGNTYKLTFYYRRTVGQGGPVEIRSYLTSGLSQVVTQNAQASPCPTVNSSWQDLWASANQTKPVLNANTLAWTLASLDFTVPVGSTNNQLLIYAQIIAPGQEGLLVQTCFDNFSLTCTASCTPQLSASTNGLDVIVADNSACSGVTSYTWDFGDNTPPVTTSTNTASHTYSQSGDYTVQLTLNYSSGCSSFTRTRVNVAPPDLCRCGTNSTVITGDVNWAGGFRELDNDVVIQPGSTLTLSQAAIVAIRENCKIVVMRGAKLDITGASTLLSACGGRKWNGIEVWGNSVVRHSTVDIAAPNLDDPGVLTTSGNASIQDMQRGIQAQRSWSDAHNTAIYTQITGVSNPIIPEYWGGIVQCDRSSFSNNRQAVAFHEYRFANTSYFRDCSFVNPVVSVTYPDPIAYEGINIWGTDHILFEKCQFLNVKQRGITALDAVISVQECAFENNRFGVVLANSGDNLSSSEVGNQVMGNQNTFFRNGRNTALPSVNPVFLDGNLIDPTLFGSGAGIWADGARGFQVVHNDFQNNQAGISATGPTAFKITNNSFRESSIGLRLNRTGMGTQTYSCNTHEFDYYGVVVSGPCAGFQFRQNEFNNRFGDLLLSNSGLPASPTAIGSNQGTTNFPVFNRFSRQAPDVLTRTPNTLFRYFPPEMGNAAQNDLLAPDCDIDGEGGPGTCNTRFEFDNQKREPGVEQNCETVIAAPECTERPCLTEFFQEWQLLLQTTDVLGTIEHAETRFRDAQLAFIKTALAEEQYASIEEMLLEFGSTVEKRMLISLFVKQKEYNKARNVLNQLVAENVEDTEYSKVQHLLLDYLSNLETFRFTGEQEQTVKQLALSFEPAAPYARALYYLVTGIYLVPEWQDTGIEGKQLQEGSFSQSAPATEITCSPNPAIDYLAIIYPGLFDGGDYQIVSAIGLPIATGLLTNQILELNTSSFDSGIYFLIATTTKGVRRTIKFAIQH